MEHGASKRVKEQSHTVMTLKAEVDKAAQSTAYRGVQTNANFTEEVPRLAELVKSEPALLVKEEVVEDGWQDIAELQCGPSTSTIVGSMDKFDSIGDLGNILNVKEELGAIDIGPTVLQHMDTPGTTNQKDMSVVKQELTVNDDKIDAILCGGVKEEIIEDKCGGSLTPPDSLMEQPGTCNALHSLHKECLETVCRVQLRRLDIFQCDVCDAVYIDAHKLRQHVQDVHGPGLRGSPHRHVKSPQISKEGQQCATADTDAQSSNKAEQSKQRAWSQLYSCDKCVKSYSSKNSLMDHCRNRHSTESHKCHKCNKKFPSKSYLYKHTNSVHSEQQYECAVCKKICKSKIALHNHVYRVHRAKPAGSKARMYTCDYCKKMFIKKAIMQRHIGHMHLSESYKCDQCNKIFKCKVYLMKHKTNMHTARLQIHTCEYCQKTFRHKSSLKRHAENIHAAAHIYPCRRCNKNFKSNDELQQHNTSIHAQYKCRVCLKVYTSKAILRRHFKKAHNSKDILFQSDVHPHEMPDLRLTADVTNAAASTSKQQHNVDVVKEEPADAELELGPVVFQHMDCNYRPYEEEPQDGSGD